MRLRVKEWMAKRGLTAYALSARSDGRISQTVAYRLAGPGKASLRLTEIEALCDVLGVQPGELFERDGKRGRAK